MLIDNSTSHNLVSQNFQKGQAPHSNFTTGRETPVEMECRIRAHIFCLDSLPCVKTGRTSLIGIVYPFSMTDQLNFA